MAGRSRTRMAPRQTPWVGAGRGFFKAIDKDGSGSLDPKELQRGFKRLGVDLRLGGWGVPEGGAEVGPVAAAAHGCDGQQREREDRDLAVSI